LLTFSASSDVKKSYSWNKININLINKIYFNKLFVVFNRIRKLVTFNI
jgi:hypothetical protein